MISNKKQEFTIRSIAKKVDIDYKTVYLIIQKLIKENIIYSKRAGQTILCSINQKIFNPDIFRAEEIRKQVTEPFWIRKEQQKHRYVYILVSKKNKKKIMRTLKHETLPYPKSRDTNESDIIKMEPIK